MATTNQRSVVYIVYETENSAAIIAAHHLFMTLMLYNYTARMLQGQVADAEKQKGMIENALRTANTVVRLVVDSDVQHGALLAQQLDVAQQLNKPIVEASLPVDVAALLAQLGYHAQAPTTDLPVGATWVEGTWRLKFFNESTLAHGYGMLKLLPDGSAQGELNIAQGTASLSTKIVAKWSLQDRQLTLNGLQQVQGLPTRLEYRLEMAIRQYNGNAADGTVAFSVKTAQGDDGVLQRDSA